MARQLEVVFERGIRRRIEPLALVAHRLVRLILDEGNVSERDSADINDRRLEFLWLANESGPYAGQWVALDGSCLMAHGTELATVSAATRAAGVERPLLTHLPPEGELPFGGW